MNHFEFMQPHEVDEYLRVFDFAYPGLNMAQPEVRERFRTNMQTAASNAQAKSRYCGIRSDDGTLIGAMQLHDFVMQMHSVKVKAGGVGFVAVDFLHKKEKVGKHLILQYLDHYAKQGYPMAILYAFRTDFYQQMGFGFGPKMNQYRLAPTQLPKGPSKSNVVYLTAQSVEGLAEFHQRFMDKTHGFIAKSAAEIEGWFKSPDTRVLGYYDNGVLRGYVLFKFKSHNPQNFGSNDIHITEFFYETPQALSELMTMLHSQADQIRTVIINTQDEYFSHLIADARNQSDHVMPHVYHETNLQGVGLMYRVLSVRGLFEALAEHNFQNVSVRVKLSIRDSFYPENDGTTIVHFDSGTARVMDETAAYDVEVSMDVAHFSSLVMGVLPLRVLVNYGLATVSNSEYTDTLTTLFQSAQPPVCVKGF